MSEIDQKFYEALQAQGFDVSQMGIMEPSQAIETPLEKLDVPEKLDS